MVVAVDPGASGGVAWMDRHGIINAVKMPATDGDMTDLLRSINAETRSTLWIEEIPKYTGANIPSSSMFVLARNYGFIEGAAQGMGMPVRRVKPADWQKPLGLGTARSCRSKTEWKNKLKAEAQRRNPALGVTLATADALLILEHAIGGQRA
jgi:hypothetical protein